MWLMAFGVQGNGRSDYRLFDRINQSFFFIRNLWFDQPGISAQYLPARVTGGNMPLYRRVIIGARSSFRIDDCRGGPRARS